LPNCNRLTPGINDNGRWRFLVSSVLFGNLLGSSSVVFSQTARVAIANLARYLDGSNPASLHN